MKNLLDQLPTGIVAEGTRLWNDAWSYAQTAPHLQYDSRSDKSDTAKFLESELMAPLRLEPDWPAASAPYPVAGSFVHQDIVDDDLPLVDEMLRQWTKMDAESVAAEAQEMRWPIVPYRKLANRPTSDLYLHQTFCVRKVSVDQLLIVDMTTHWAGPLATKFLANQGATVIKVDPNCRPDGMRARPMLYQHLNNAKDLVDLDLRRNPDRSEFESLLRNADVLVESFSRRVLPNFGYTQTYLRNNFPDLAVLSVKSFEHDSDEASWLAYGSGIHAISGLGMTKGIPSPAPLPYPDFLAGLATLRAILRSVATATSQVEVSLMASVAPLIAIAAGGSCSE